MLELKIGGFRPDHIGQLGFYVSAVDDLVRDHRMHQRTVGILLCADRDDQVVRYSLAGNTTPLAVSTYTFDELPAAERVVLPTEAQLARALSTPTPDETAPRPTE